MQISKSARYALGVCATVAILAGCGGGSPSSLGPSSGVIPEKRKDACSTVHTLGGQTYTVAHLGGGNHLDVESSAYENCDIGIYISPADGPASLNHSTINGAFKIGVYLDRAGTTKLNQDSICVNGTNQNLTCAPGSGRSTGAGLDAQRTPDLTVTKTYIDGYVAGLATSPCPNSANKITVNQSTISRSTYPWSLQGGKIIASHDSPPSGGRCSGAPPSGSNPQLLYVTNGGNSTITVYDEQGNQQTLPGSFPGLYYPSSLVYDPNNQLIYVGNGNNANYMTAYDTSGNQQTLQQGAFPNLGDPFGIAYDPSTALLYVTNYQLGNGNYGGITVYDEMGNPQTLSGSFFGAYQTNDIAYDPNNGFLYNSNYGCCGQAPVTVYDQNGILQTLSGSFPGLTHGPVAIMYNPSNRFIYVSQLAYYSSISAFDENGNPQTLSGSWSGINFPSGMAYDPNNGLIYVVNSGGGSSGSTITAYDNNGNQQTLSGSFPGLSYSSQISVVPASDGSRARKHHRASHPSMSTSGETTTPRKNY
jgi:DNA-binding beta-propeller fold protein YncE